MFVETDGQYVHLIDVFDKDLHKLYLDEDK